MESAGEPEVVVAGRIQRCVSGERSRIADDERHTRAAFPGRGFLALEPTGGAAVVGPVVGRENDNRVLEQAVFAESVHDFAHRPVEFAHHVVVEIAGGVGCVEFFRDREGRMRHGVGEVEEKRPILVPPDEVHRLRRVFGRDEPLIDGVLHDLFVVHHPDGQHVVRVEDAVVFLETVTVGVKLRLVAQVPFADDAGPIAGLLIDFPQGEFVCREAQ